MATEVKKIKNLDYNELITLTLIENDEDLNNIFVDEIKMSYNLLRTLSEEGKLNEKTKDFIKEIFEMIVLTKTNLISKYLNLAKKNGIAIQIIGELDEEESLPEEQPEQEPEEVPNPKKEPSEGKLPRRYGKASIEKDILAQGGKATNVQLTGLAVNELKNLWVNLSSKMIKELLSGEQVLSDEDYRTIRSTIKMMKNKLAPILLKK